MTGRRGWRIVFRIAILIGIIVVLYSYVYVPWSLYWGAASEEITRAMPGDSLVQMPRFNATRAVTIEATPEQIWPWLVQMGYKQGGFYSWDRLDNDGCPSADSILPKYQDLQVGDRLPMSKSAYAQVLLLEPPNFMLVQFEHDNGMDWGGATWVWGLYQTKTGHTRLVSRLRARMEHSLAKIMMDNFEIIMMRKHLLGIKRRAEVFAGDK